MKVAVIVASICLVALVSGAPNPDLKAAKHKKVITTPSVLESKVTTEPTSTSDEEEDVKVIVTKDFFGPEFLFYTSEHDIVSITIPINGLNFPIENDDDDCPSDDSAAIFFVEADIKDGKKDYKGLYVHNKNSTKLVLANGRDAASSIDDRSKDAFFAADDGIYSYDHTTRSASKYGTFDKSIFAIAKPNGTDEIYVITDDKELYKIKNEGKDALKINEINNPEAIVVDNGNNLYFYTTGNAPAVYKNGQITNFTDLPTNPSYVALLRPTFIGDDESIVAVIDDKAYVLYSNGTSSPSAFTLKVHPTAYGMEAGLIHYYAYDKKIYEYNFLEMFLQGMMAGLRDYAETRSGEIQRYASQSRSSFNRR